MKRFIFLALVLLLPVLACNLGGVETTPTPDADGIATAVAATLTAAAGAGGVETPAPSEAAPAETPAQPTATPAAGPPPLTPAGVIVGTEDGEVTIYNPAGQPITGYLLPDLSFREPQYVHFAGPFGPGPIQTVLVYYTLQNGGELRVHNGQSSSPYVSAPNLIAMAGAPAQPVVAYSLFVTPTSGYDTSSELYVGTLDNPPTAPLLSALNEDGYALYPLAVAAENGQPVGVWYTKQLWGIGNVAFAPTRGLYYLDVATAQVTEVLPDVTTQEEGTFINRTAGLSPDATWMAWTMEGPNVAPYSMFWAPVEDQTQTKSVMPGLPYDMGAGFAVFSPGNQYLAWNTASSGTQPGMVNYYLHINATDGVSGSFSELPTAGSLLNPDMVWAITAGWLDGDTLLLRGRMTDEQWHVFSLNPVSSMLTVNGQPGQALQAQDFALGEFMGFVYP